MSPVTWVLVSPGTVLVFTCCPGVILNRVPFFSQIGLVWIINYMFTLLPMITNPIHLTKIDPRLTFYPIDLLICAPSLCFLRVGVVSFIASVVSVKQYFYLIYRHITILSVALKIPLIASLCLPESLPSPTKYRVQFMISIGFTCLSLWLPLT